MWQAEQWPPKILDNIMMEVIRGHRPRKVGNPNKVEKNKEVDSP